MKTFFFVKTFLTRIPISLLLVFFFIHHFNAFTFAKSEKIKLRVGYAPVLSQLPIVESYEKHKLIWQQIDVRLMRFSSYTGLDAALRADAIDMAYLPLPAIIQQRADNVKIRIIGSLHKVKPTVILIKQSASSRIDGRVIGVPSTRSSELLILSKKIRERDSQIGMDSKMLGVSFDNVFKEIKMGHISGFMLPEPYPTIAIHQLQKYNVEEIQVRESSKMIFEGLAIREDFLDQGKMSAMCEYLKSLSQSCNRIEEDIHSYNGIGTAIAQEHYFGFPVQLVSESIQRTKNFITFNFSTIEKRRIRTVVNDLLSLKLLLMSVDPEDISIQEEQLSIIFNQVEN